MFAVTIFSPETAWLVDNVRQPRMVNNKLKITKQDGRYIPLRSIQFKVPVDVFVRSLIVALLVL